MLAISTSWNVGRTGSFAAALAEIRSLGFSAAELAGEGGDLAAVPSAARERRIRLVAADGMFTRTAARDVDRLEPGFASTVPEERERAAAALLTVAARAKRCGTNRVLIRCGGVAVAGAEERFADWEKRAALGGVSDEIREEAATLRGEREAARDAHLDAACRTMNALSRADPETEWWILPAARPDAFPLPDELEFLLAEIPGGRPAFVHDPAAAAVLASLGVAPATAWLDVAGGRLAALRLSDAFGLETGLPPGSGIVDWASVRDATVAGLPRILHVTRACSPEELLEAARLVE